MVSPTSTRAIRFTNTCGERRSPRVGGALLASTHSLRYWADHWEQHKDEFTHETDFDEYRNRLGGLLLLPKTFNSSYNDWSYTKKLPKYLEQNLLAQSLNPNAYDRNPPLKKLKEAGLPFAGHEEFRKADIERRQKLYVAIAKQVWNPNRLNDAAGHLFKQQFPRFIVSFDFPFVALSHLERPLLRPGLRICWGMGGRFPESRFSSPARPLA